jgi:UPF0755 protein
VGPGAPAGHPAAAPPRLPIGRVVGIILLLLGVASGGYLWSHIVSPGPLVKPLTLVVPKGATPGEIALKLAQARVIASPLLFEAAIRFSSRDRPPKAGEYAFTPAMSAREVLAMLQEGRTVVRRLMVPEGLTTQQVIARLEAAAGLEGGPGPLPAEGALLPATYTYAWGDSREQMVRKMSEAMRRTVDQLWATRAPGLPFATPEEAVILASIVEKETGIAAERPRIAAVFVNRLKAGMRLQADPTVAYGVGGADGALGRPLSRADLRAAHPYNTYLVAGLPPGPIANPGRAAIAAVLQPATTDELFFVADGSGGHAFARTYEEHKANVARWRTIEDGRDADGGNAD